MTIRIFQPDLLVCFIATLSISDCAVANWVCDPTFYLPAAILHHGTNECLVTGFCQEAGHQFKWSTKKDSDATFTVHTDKTTQLETFVFPDEPCKFYVRCEITGEEGSEPWHDQLYVDITNMIYVVVVTKGGAIQNQLKQGALFVTGAAQIEPADVPLDSAKLIFTPNDDNNYYRILTGQTSYQTNSWVISLTKQDIGNDEACLISNDEVARWFAEDPQNTYTKGEYGGTEGNTRGCSYHHSYALTIGTSDLTFENVNGVLTVQDNESAYTPTPDCFGAPSVNSGGVVDSQWSFLRITPTESVFTNLQPCTVFRDKYYAHEAVHLAQGQNPSWFNVDSNYVSHFENQSYCCQGKGQAIVNFDTAHYKYYERLEYDSNLNVAFQEFAAFDADDAIEPHYLEYTDEQKTEYSAYVASVSATINAQFYNDVYVVLRTYMNSYICQH